MKRETLTLSLPVCPACGKPHHLPLVFLEMDNGEYSGQCTNNLEPIRAVLDKTGRLIVKP